MYEVYEFSNRKYRLDRPQYAVALSFLNNLTPGKVLDLCCGVGEISDILKDKGHSVVAVDGMKEFVDQVSQRHESYCVNIEHEKLPFNDNEFDYIVSLDAIEHIWNTKAYFEEIKRVLKSDGLAIITTTNYSHIKYRIYSLLGRFHHFTFRSRHKKFYDNVSFENEIKDYMKVKEYLGVLHIPKLYKGLVKNKFVISLFCETLGIVAEDR